MARGHGEKAKISTANASNKMSLLKETGCEVMGVVRVCGER